MAATRWCATTTSWCGAPRRATSRGARCSGSATPRPTRGPATPWRSRTERSRSTCRRTACGCCASADRRAGPQGPGSCRLDALRGGGLRWGERPRRAQAAPRQDAPGPDDPDGCGQWQVRGRGTAREHDVTRLEREEAVHAGRGQTRGLEAEAHGPCGARREREPRVPDELDGRPHHGCCLLYTSDAADDLLCVDLG